MCLMHSINKNNHMYMHLRWTSKLFKHGEASNYTLAKILEKNAFFFQNKDFV